MRFVLFVEGRTEKEVLPAFLKRWLDPQLSQPVRITPVFLEGAPEYGREIEKKARLHLTGNRSADVIAGIGLLDLYGIPNYPDSVRGVSARYAWAKKHFEDKVGQSKFRQHFAVHELEAWLLADRQIFPPEISRALPGSVENPETVNFDTPPAKLLNRLYSDKLREGYKKFVHGKDLFSKLDPEIARGKCPYLRAMLDDMLALATSAAP